MDGSRTYLGLQAAVTNGTKTYFIQLQAYDIWGPLEAGSRRVTQQMPAIDELGVHYKSSFEIVGISCFHQGFPAAFMGNYFDFSALQEDFQVDDGICGFYYAYQTATGYLAGFRPIMCEHDHE